MSKNYWHGLKGVAIALLTDEDSLTYETPVRIPSAVNCKADPESETIDAQYADDDVWVDEEEHDTGGTGSLEFRDILSNPTLRALFAAICGFDIDTNGRLLATADKDPQPFALMAEQGGKTSKKRRCFLHCVAKKPSIDWSTDEKQPTHATVSFDYKWRPVVVTTGTGSSATTWKGNYYEDYEGSSTWSTFYDAVDTSLAPASEGN